MVLFAGLANRNPVFPFAYNSASGFRGTVAQVNDENLTPLVITEKELQYFSVQMKQFRFFLSFFSSPFSVAGTTELKSAGRSLLSKLRLDAALFTVFVAIICPEILKHISFVMILSVI